MILRLLISKESTKRDVGVLFPVVMGSTIYKFVIMTVYRNPLLGRQTCLVYSALIFAPSTQSCLVLDNNIYTCYKLIIIKKPNCTNC